MNRSRSHPLILFLICLGCTGPGQATVVAVETSNPAAEFAAGRYEAVVQALLPKHQAGTGRLQEYLLLSRALKHLSRHPEAITVAKTIIAAVDDHIEANALLGDMLLTDNQAKDALPHLQLVFKRVQKPRWAVRLGQAHLQMQEPDKAKAYLEQALQLGSHDASVTYHLGRLQLQRGYGYLAERYLRQCAEAGGHGSDLGILRAEAMALQHKWLAPLQYKECDPDWQPGSLHGKLIVIARHPNNKRQALVSEGDCALLFALQALQKQPDSLLCLRIATEAWISAGLISQAKTSLQHLQSKHGAQSHQLLQLRLTETEGVAKQWQAVLTRLKPGPDLDATRLARSWQNLAAHYRLQGQSSAATECLAQADRLAPTSAAILRSCMTLHRSLGNTKEALAYIKRLLDIHPDVSDRENLLKVQQDLEGADKGVLP